MKLVRTYIIFSLLLVYSFVANGQSLGYFVKSGQETGTFKGGIFIGWGAKYVTNDTLLLTGGDDTVTTVLWTNLTGVTRAGDTLTKTSSVGWGNAGATSYNQLKKLENGWVDYKVSSLYNVIAFGLSCKNNAGTLDSIEYAVVVDSGTIEIYNLGVLIGSFGSVAVNDSIRIEKLGDVLFYSKNQQVFYNQHLNPKRPFYINVSIYSATTSLVLATSISGTKTNAKNSFVLNAGADQTVCESTPVRLGGAPTIFGGIEPYTYTWSPSTFLSSSSASNPTASPDSAITYVVTVVDSRGTTKTDTVTISVFETPVANAGSPQTICSGAPVSIGGSPTGSDGTSPYTYLWSPTDSINYDTVANPTVNPSITTLYTVIVMDTNSCYSTSSVTITVKPAIEGFAGNDTTIYKRDSIYIGGSPTAAFGTAPYSYNWSPSTGLNNDTLANPRAYPNVTTSYILTITDDGGCATFIDTVLITVDSMPYVNAGDDVTICLNDTATIGGSIVAKGGTLPLTYDWLPTTGLSNASIANPKASPDTTTTYVLTVEDDDGHIKTDTVVVTVNSLPTAYAGNDTSSYTGNIALGADTVAMGGVPPYNYSWTSATETILINDIANPFVRLTDTDTFYLAVSDSNSCIARDTVTVDFDDIFGSSCNLDSCTWTVDDIDSTNFTIGAGQKLCIRKTGIARGTIVLNNGGSICSSGRLEPASFAFNGGTLTNNATGTIVLSDTLVITDSAQLINDGLVQVTGKLFADTASSFTNNGNIEVSEDVDVKTFAFNNYGVITLDAADFTILSPALVNNYGTVRGVSSFKNYDTLSLGDDGLIFATNFYNYSTGITKKISSGSSSTGGIVVCSVTNNAGTITDSVDICDKTPSAGPVFLDTNTGTVNGAVTYCQRYLTQIDSAEACGSCPTLALESNGCEGDLVTFMATSAKTFDYYEFFRNDTSVQYSTDASYTLIQSAVEDDVYKVKGFSLRSACKQVISDTLVIHARPSVSIAGDTMAIADSVTLTASGAVTYIWALLDGTIIDTATTITVLPAVTTTYVVSGINSNGCIDTAHHQLMRELGISYTIQAPTYLQPYSGAIDLEMTGGRAPFTFEWNTGSTDEGLKNIPVGSYHVSVTDADGQNAEKDIVIATAITWTGTTGVTTTTTSVTRIVTPGGTWDTAGSVSADVIYGDTDGWVEFKIGETDDTVVVGLGTGDNHGGYTPIRHAVMVEDGVLKVYESGTFIENIGTAITGDKVRIERTGTSVLYKVNDVTERTSSTDSKLDLVINTGIKTHGGVIPYLHGQFTGLTYEHLHTFHILAYENVCEADLSKNYVHTVNYDENGDAIADGKVFYDYLGRATQTQMRVISDDDVLATQTLYDVYGRVVLQTLPAPINQSDLCYKDKFITNASGNDYTVNDFDLTNYSHLPNAYYPGEVNRPKPVGNSTADGLGWYYSKNNFDEPFVAASSYPYTRVEYDNNNLGALRKSTAAGELLNMGSGHEAQSYSMFSLNETDYLYGKNKGWVVSDYTDADYNGLGEITPTAITAGSRVTKTISVDQNGQESLVFNDLEGKTLASCLSGQVDDSNVNTWALTTTVTGSWYIDVHLPKGCENSLTISNTAGNTFRILNLKTGNYVKFENSLNFSGTTPNLVAGYYRIILYSGPHTGRDGYIPTLSVSQNVNYYNFTIYYYDKAGRLKLTVPPAGVDAYTPSTGTVPEHQMIASAEYNSLSMQHSAISPDASITMYLYAKDGRLRFSQNAKQRASNADYELRKFSYINYDDLGRVIETGEYDPTVSSVVTPYYFDKLLPGIYSPADNNPTSAILESTSATGSNLDAGRCSQQNYVMYDVAASPPLSYEQKHLAAKVSKTWNDVSATWYSYDELGRTTWTIQGIEDMPSGTTYKTINYTYDFNGNVTQVAYQQEDTDEDFYHFYEYDADKRLKKAYVSNDPIKYGKELATYGYYKHGPLKRVELANKLQGVDYVYTINGWLKSINNPELNEKDPGKDGTIYSSSHSPKDLFGMSLDYFAGDYRRPGTYVQTYDTPENYGLLLVGPPVDEISKNLYNGIIKGQRWQTAIPTGASGLEYTSSQLMNAYLYDNKYQLTKSTFGTITSAGTLNLPASNNGSVNYLVKGYKGPLVSEEDDYKVSGITYDYNGNITALNRNGFETHTGGLHMDELDYNYNSSGGRLINNKLRHVTDAAPTSSPNSEDYNNFGFNNGQSTDNYTYDEIGQLTGDANGEQYTEYDVYGKVTAIYSDASKTVLTAAFTYDDRGHRLKKTDGASTTFYVRDAGGSPLSIYAQSTAMSPLEQEEMNLFGDRRLGVYKVQAGTYLYELMDHLGNVRTTFTEGLKTTISTEFDKQGDDDYLFAYNANLDFTTGYAGDAPSVKLPPNGNYGTGLLDYPITNGQNITGTIKYKTSGSTAPDAVIAIAITDATTGALLQWTPATINASNTGWSTLNFTLPANNTGILRLYTFNNDPLQTVWFDDLIINFAGTGAGIASVEGVSLTDYYAHGSIMPGRSLNPTDYRYGYQGQFSEKDNETNQNSFILRNYDGLLGRWMTIDPYGEYHSPYLAMGNNPVNMVDPDGGCVDCPPPGTYIAEDANGYQYSMKPGTDIPNGYTYIGGADHFAGRVMWPSSYYDYSQGTIDGKFTDDWNYITGGAWYEFGARYTQVFWRDLTAPTNRETAEASVAIVMGMGSLSGAKEAVRKAQEKVGGSLPKGPNGKFGSPQRGNSKKGYRLDPGHPGKPEGHPEAGPHVNWWDYTNGKRNGTNSGAFPFK